jgi:hypothetical protein
MGCKNGGGALSLEEYFQLLDELDNEFSTASDSVDSQIEATEDLDEIRGLMDDQVANFDDFIDGLEDLEPPEEASEPHDEAIAGLSDFRDELSAALDETDSATTIDELFAPFDDLDYSSLERATAACLALEQIGADNGITVDLDCDEDDGGADGNGTDGDGTDGDATALEEYFLALDALENDYREQQDALTAQAEALDESSLAEAAGLFEELVSVVNDFASSMDALDPPPEAAEAHAETVAGFQTVAALIEDALPAIEQAQTLDDVSAVLESAEFTSADESLDGACNALQSIADANGITVDLGCGE